MLKEINNAGERYLMVDLRENGERVKHGVIPNSIHAPYSRLDQHLEMLSLSGQQIVFYCAAGERSAMAVKLAGGSGVRNCAHLPVVTRLGCRLVVQPSDACLKMTSSKLPI